ncbi:MAG: hypothetical protein QNJ69_10425 [Gammaproteobacteria bacterium]|nr:hypothetical protein [Gammaproteobacteria bacterium]
MKSLLKSSLLGCLLLTPGLLHANDFEAALTSETAQFTFRSDSSLIGWGGSELGFSLFYNEASDYLGQVSLLQRRQSSQQTPLTLGVGARLYLGQLDDVDSDIFAAGIGGEIRYTFPGVMPKSVYLRGHYAPKITSFADADEIQDFNLGFQIEVLPQTTAFVGVRHLEVDLDVNGNVDYEMDDDRVHIGIRMTF